MLRYYDGKNSMTRTEKGSIRLDRKSVREINKYTLQDDSAQPDVPRIGMYILQEERCWELLPPEEELEAWIAKLQLVIKTLFERIERAGFHVPGTQVEAFPLFGVLDGKNTGDYVQRVEPSVSGGRKLAAALLLAIGLVLIPVCVYNTVVTSL